MKTDLEILYNIIAPSGSTIKDFNRRSLLDPFDDVILDFIDAVSKFILENHSFRRFPELVAMAFWMRKASIKRLESRYEKTRVDRILAPRGTVFHIAPSNVDTIFVYSWFLSMLLGNRNIVRISSDINEPVGNLLDVINEISSDIKYSLIRDRFLIVQYEHNDDVTEYFSSLCDTRVIWGGDRTIRKIRAISLRPTATELVFADKFSFSVIDAAAYNSSDEKDKLILNFINDAYWFGQNACSSPRMVVWLGDDKEVSNARAGFWGLLEKKIITQFENAPAIAINKLVAESLAAIGTSADIKIERSETGLVNRILFSHFGDINRNLHCGGGLFYEARLDNLNELADKIEPKDQTMTVFGIENSRITEFLRKIPRGINRIVPVGQALNFSAIWDGYDLIREFSREIEITI